MKKVVLTIGSISSGGAERVLCDIANHLNKIGISVIVIVTKRMNNEYRLNSGIEIISLNEDKENKDENKIIKNIKYILKFRNYIKKINPDTILSFLLEPNFRTIISTAGIKSRVIVSVRNDPDKEYNNFILKKIADILYSFADGVVFQTEYAKMCFHKNIRKKGKIIPNSVNESFIRERYLGDRDKEIVTVGRLFKQKNHKLLIDAFEIISKKYPDYNLKIYGEGPERKNLEKQIKELGMEDSVCLMGMKDDINKYIYKSKMFILSSDYEGIPNALLEAMSLGLPVISTRCSGGGAEFLIENEVNGLLIPVGNKWEMAKAIERLLEDNGYCNQLSKNANQISLKLSPAVILDNWANYLLESMEIENEFDK